MDGSDEGAEVRQLWCNDNTLIFGHFQCPANSIVTVKSQPVVAVDTQINNNNQQRTNNLDVQKVIIILHE